MMKKRRGKIFVLSSPSGGGKTSVCERLKSERLGVRYSVSATTRSPRKNEKSGRDYIFLSKDEFKKMRAKGKFLEWTNNFGDLYGTPKAFVKKTISSGKDVLLAIDVKGAMQIKKMEGSSVLMFLLPPSLRLLEKRLRGRNTEGRETIARRLRIARRELSYSKRYDYAVLNNSLRDAVDTVKAILIAERNRIRR
ncbi:MAG: guanylate kinase [Candidatus Omnitrophota bacterium]